MEIKHIYWFSYFNLDEPSVRYRAKYPLEYLSSKHNISYSLVLPGYDLRNFSNFLIIYFSVLFFRKKDSLIVFQKIYSKGIYAAALKFLLWCKPANTLYDIDDAEHTRRPAETILYFMKRCTVCAAGSEWLVNYIKQFNTNVIFLTSPVIDHGIVKEKVNKQFTVGWIGYYGAHRKSLTAQFFPALIKVDFEVRFKVLGIKNIEEEEDLKSIFAENKNIVIDAPLNLDWYNERSIYEAIRTFDAGVSPLIVNDFNLAKSAFKLKQCLSCGVPVLGSSTGENSRFLEDGVNGYLCDSPEEYYEKLLKIKNADAREYEKLSKNAAATFPDFSIENYAGLLLGHFAARQ